MFPVQKVNITSVAVVIIVASLTVASYLIYQPAKKPEEVPEQQNTTVAEEVPITKTIETKKVSFMPTLNPKFPQCYVHYEYTVLSNILNEFYLKSDECTELKCHSRNNKKDSHSTETTGLIVAYVAISVLLISLIAAFLEVIRAKKDPVQNRTKPELSRRCSLADLTLLRHSRRESLMRRDSSMSLSIPESSGRVPMKNIGRKMSRPRLRVN